MSFVIVENYGDLPSQRPLRTVEGRADRMRTAAFAEVLARDAFRWAARTFVDAPLPLREAWTTLASEEEKHLGWLLSRMEALGQRPEDRPVSSGLGDYLKSARTAREFAVRMASAEERGRRAGETFQKKMAGIDPVSAEMFGRIAREEAGHIALARKFFK